MTEHVADLGELLDEWTEVTRLYRESVIDATRRLDDQENQVRDDWHDQHYLSVGEEAVQIATRVLLGNLRGPPETILDFPSGSGRVTRHLRAMFPGARIGACDLNPEHVAFCEQQFGAEPILSRENLDDLDIRPEWDLVFCGSLLTHLPESLFWPAVRFIARALSPTGIAVVTLEGRRAEDIQDRAWKLIDDERFEKIRRRYRRTGFGFADYVGDMRRLFPAQSGYGVALVKPSWVMAGLEQMSEIRILGYTERAWDDHQDMVVFGRPAAVGDH
jgi:SAM-dependent methyltransferase